MKKLTVMFTTFVLISFTYLSPVQVQAKWFPVSESFFQTMIDAVNRVIANSIVVSEDQLEADLENYLFQQINQSRSLHGLPLLNRNTNVDNVAKNWSQVQAEYKTSSHNINLGYDLITNNAQSFYYSENIGYGIVQNPNIKQEYINILSIIHNGMMAEVPPYDGHRQTILSDTYQYVGIGIEIEDGEFWITTDYIK
jgi:uncharacterized protein YkwD